LFQWRVLRGLRVNQRRVCEERIVTFRAASPEAALARATRLGKEGEYREERDGKRIHFEFVGVLQLMDLLVDDPIEVWWELRERLRPMERRRRLLPAKRNLYAFDERPSKRRRLKPW
jgi:hypothetical protein